MKSKTGSALVIVIVGSIAIGIIATSVVSLLATQRKLSVQKELQLQANNVAESAIDYLYSYMVYDLMANGRSSTNYIKATGANDVTSKLPASVQTYLTGTVASPGGFTGSATQVTFSDLKIKVLPRTSTTPLRYKVDGNDARNAKHPGKNLWVEEYTVPIIATVKAKLGKQTYTAYIQKDLADIVVPPFQHAIFYEMQLQVHRGYPILGAVHTNADLIMNAQSGDTAKYNGSVTCHGRFYRGSVIDVGGSGADPYGFAPIKGGNNGLDFTYTDPTTGEVVNPVATNTTSLKILSATKPSVTYAQLALTMDSRKSTWKNDALSTFGGFLQDISHDVPALTLPGGKGYQQDVAATPAVNEFSNLPYALIEPVLPSTHAANKSKDIQSNNLNANASLILRIESTRPVVASGATGIQINKSVIAADPTKYFVVKAYKYADPSVEPWNRDPTNSVNLTPVWLPKGIVGICNNLTSTTALGITTFSGKDADLVFEKYAIDTSSKDVTGGLHDARLGRGVHLLTINMARLKDVMEKPYADCSPDERAFRLTFNTVGDDWKSCVLYVQFPTDLTTAVETSPSASPVAVWDAVGAANVEGAKPSIGTAASGALVIGDSTTPMKSWAFAYGNPELRHPNRWGADTTGTTTTADNHGRVSRTDKIVPLAPELRKYPASYSDSEIMKQDWCIPAVQIINAHALPKPGTSKSFLFGTNGPVYLVGSYNSDNDITTNTNLTSTLPTAYADADTSIPFKWKNGTTTNEKAVCSMIMCDMLTFLSKDWFDKNLGSSRYGNRRNSFWGGDKDAIDYRKVTSGPVEIDACIATGGYPIFEFFAHTLEDWGDFYNKTAYPNPIIIKGAMVAEWESEIQHIKQAYGRDKQKDIQVYWSDHGAFGIPAVRFHKRLVDGDGPDFPKIPIYAQKGFQLLRPGKAADKAMLTSAGL